MPSADDSIAQQVLARYYRSIGRATVSSGGVTPGLSGARIWKVKAGRGALALRRWPATGPDAATLGKIHSMLAHAAGNGIDFVPVPVTSDSAATSVAYDNSLWELAPWMPGVAAERGSLEKLLVAVKALARFHQATADFPMAEFPTAGEPRGRSPAIAHRRQQLEQAIATDWRELAGRAARESSNPTTRQLLETLSVLLPPALHEARERLIEIGEPEVPLQPIIRDARREHFLFTGEGAGAAVSGLVDFGAMTIDTPAVDLARLLGEWAGGDRRMWRAATEVYDAKRPSMRLLEALDASGVALSAANWITWIAEGQPASSSRLQHLVDRLRS